LPWITIVVVEHEELRSLPRHLGPGEREVLVLALHTPDPLLLLDDALARRQAQALRLPFTGTLGTLLKARQAGLVAAIAATLDRFDQLGFRLDPGTRASVLRLAGEQDGD
jgi:predicted nucleic acid-binding protein